MKKCFQIIFFIIISFPVFSQGRDTLRPKKGVWLFGMYGGINNSQITYEPPSSHPETFTDNNPTAHLSLAAIYRPVNFINVRGNLTYDNLKFQTTYGSIGNVNKTTYSFNFLSVDLLTGFNIQENNIGFFADMGLKVGNVFLIIIKNYFNDTLLRADRHGQTSLPFYFHVDAGMYYKVNTSLAIVLEANQNFPIIPLRERLIPGQAQRKEYEANYFSIKIGMTYKL